MATEGLPLAKECDTEAVTTFKEAVKFLGLIDFIALLFKQRSKCILRLKKLSRSALNYIRFKNKFNNLMIVSHQHKDVKSELLLEH